MCQTIFATANLRKHNAIEKCTCKTKYIYCGFIVAN